MSLKTKVITLEVLEDYQAAISYVTLTNSNGDTFEILDSYRNEELINFINRSEHKSKTDVSSSTNERDINGQREQLKSFADYVQKRAWEDGDKDLSEFVDEFLRI